MSLNEINDHVDKAQVRMVKRFKGKTNIDKIIKIRVARLQVLEAILIRMMNERSLSNSVGVQLDGIGQFYGDNGLRGNRSDDEYRAYILTLPSKLREAGQVNVLIDALKNLTSSGVSLIQSFPRVVLMHIFSDLLFNNQNEILSAMDSVRAQGVNLEIGVQKTTGAFIFSSNIGGGNIGEGFATTALLTDGGVFVSMLGTVQQFLILSESGFVILSEDGEKIKSDIGL